MGCDIHAMIEAKRKYEYQPDAWSWTSCGRVHIARNYTLFARIGDVRNYGLAVAIGSNRLTPAQNRSDFNDEVCSEDFDCLRREWGQDGHSHSYVTLDELETADAVLAARCRLVVLAHGFDPDEARLVFFFDN